MMTKPESYETKIALINANIGFIQKDVSEIKASIKDLTGVYITKLEFEDTKKSVDGRVVALEKSSNLWKWLSPTLAASLSAVVTFLIIQYISHIK